MNKYNKFWLFIGLSGLTVLLSAFMLTLLGVIDLRYLNQDTTALSIFSIILFLANLYFVFKITLRLSAKATIIALIGYIPVSIIASTLLLQNMPLVSSALAPFLYGFAIAVKQHKKFKYIVNFSIFWVSISLYQLVSYFIKIGLLYPLEYQELGALSTLLISIDLFIVYIWYERMVICYVVSKQFHVLPKEERISEPTKLRKEVLGEDLTQRQRVIFALLSQGYQVFQLLVVLSLGLINNAIAELAVMLVMFWIGRKILEQSWHSERLWICSCAAFAGFYILTKITLPFSVSLFATVALSGGFVYLMHILGLKSDRLEELEARYDDDYTKYGLSKEMAKFAYDWLTAGLHDKELIVKYQLSGENTLNSRKRRIKAKINSI